MKRSLLTLVIILLMLATTSAALASSPDTRTFLSRLSGANEVPARDTDAHGTAVFVLNPAEDELKFVLVVADIDNVTAAHIHCGAAGVNAPVGITLFSGGAPGSGSFDGLLSRGVATAPDANNGCGWDSLGEAVAAMRTGNTYVNVHTNDGVAPTNTGPGDFPGGEIRDQVHPMGADH